MLIGVAALVLGGSLPAMAAPARALPMAVSDADLTSPDQVTDLVDAQLAIQGSEVELGTDLVDPATIDAVVAADSPAEVDNLDMANTPAAEVELGDPAGEVTAWVSPALATDSFNLAGISWEGDTPPSRVLARTADQDGWSDWVDLDLGLEDGPDAGSPEAMTAKQATAPLVAPEASGIQIQVLSQPGADLPPQITPVLVPTAATSGIMTMAVAKPASGSLDINKPAIHPRSDWKAKPARENDFAKTPASLNGAIIHHTVNSNSYSAAQVPTLLYNIQSYHMGANGWADIGYNFVIDRFGGIWEARQGSLREFVVGAHANPFNSGTIGVSFLGDHTSATPSAASVDSAGRLIAWRLATSGITNLKGTTVFTGDPAKKPRDVVSGHRQVNATSCPGDKLMAKLPTIRGYTVEPYKATAPFAQIVLSPRLTGGPGGEVLAVDDKGYLVRYPFTPPSKLGAVQVIGQGWQDTRLFAPGRWDGDGIADLVGIDAEGLMWLYPGNGAGGIKARKQIGHGWKNFTVIPAGDLDGDGIPDMLAINLKTGVLTLYSGNGKGGFKPGYRQVGHGWLNMQLFAAGDLNKDRKADILGVKADGTLLFYAGKGTGTFQPAKQVGHGWTGMILAAGADLNGDGKADIVGKTRDRRLLFYQGKGIGTFQKPVQIGQGW